MILVRNLAESLAQFYPPALRKQIKRQMPALKTQGLRLALEVLDAEAREIRFAEAILRPDFPLMGRVHFGVRDTLLHRIPKQLRQSLREMLCAAAEGDFDDLRQLMFAIASRRADPEAALCRFMFWQAIRMNVMVMAWDEPFADLSGALEQVEDQSENALRSILQVPEMFEDDMRPLHVLVAEASVRVSSLTTERFGEIALLRSELAEEVLQTVEDLQSVRSLNAADAAMLWPGPANGPLGSQQIADRFPQHFSTANDVDQRRSRARRRRPTPAPGDRLIDLLRDPSILESAL